MYYSREDEMNSNFFILAPFLGMKMQLNKENPGKYKGNSIVVELEHKCLARVFHSTKTKSVPIQML